MTHPSPASWARTSGGVRQPIVTVEFESPSLSQRMIEALLEPAH
jgi:hypothetical protein